MTISADTRKRVVVLLTLVAFALTLLLAGAVVANADDASAARSDADITYVQHTVRTGDTLWDIAAVHTVADADLRNLVDDIKRTNDLASSVIVPGQVLRIPVDA